MAAADRTGSSVSFVVQVLDDLTGRAALAGATDVFITETGQRPIRTPSGFYVFTGPTATQVTVRIENKYYFPKQAAVDITTLDSRNPVTTQTVKPGYLYPFPAASTLVRGLVRDAANHPVPGAQISVTGATVGNESETDGRFVLYWGPLGEDDISVVNTRRLVTIANSTTISLQVSHPSFQPQTVNIGTVPEGELTLLTTPIILSP